MRRLHFLLRNPAAPAVTSEVVWDPAGRREEARRWIWYGMVLGLGLAP